MKWMGKPVNRWGWVRVAGLAALGLILLWALLAALLPAALNWSAYRGFGLAQALQAAIIPLLAVFLGGWLEEQDAKTAAEHSQHHSAQQAANERRAELLQQLQAALGAGDPAQLPGLIRAALPELDAKGRGEALHLLHDTGLIHADQPAVDLSGADFSGLVYKHPRLERVCLQGVNLSKARMNDAHLAHSRLDGADLSRAFLRHASLRQANLAGCNLQSANLEGANLEGADLSGANLTGTLLAHAHLKGCQVSPQALETAILVETTLPDGQKLTNEPGKQHLREKELTTLVDKL